MDSFTIAVVVGSGFVILVFAALVIFDKGAPPPAPVGSKAPKSAKAPKFQKAPKSAKGARSPKATRP